MNKEFKEESVDEGSEKRDDQKRLASPKGSDKMVEKMVNVLLGKPPLPKKRVQTSSSEDESSDSSSEKTKSIKEPE